MIFLHRKLQQNTTFERPPIVEIQSPLPSLRPNFKLLKRLLQQLSNGHGGKKKWPGLRK